MSIVEVAGSLASHWPQSAAAAPPDAAKSVSDTSMRLTGGGGTHRIGGEDSKASLCGQCEARDPATSTMDIGGGSAEQDGEASLGHPPEAEDPASVDGVYFSVFLHHGLQARNDGVHQVANF